jgi:hypothetical protein
LRSGLIEVTEQATITFPATGTAALVQAVAVPPAASSTPGWLYPVLITLAVLLVAVTLVMVHLLRRRRLPQPE